MSDLAALFPDLPPEILNDFDSSQRAYQSNAPIQVGGEQAQVTDDQIAAYLQSLGSLRAPLPPIVSGQQSPPVPEFTSGRGQVAPSPDAAYVEAPDLGDIPGNQPNQPNQPNAVQTPTNPPSSQPPLATETTPLPLPVSPPTDLPLSPPTAPPYEDEPPPSPPAATRTDGIEALASLWDNDPELRNIVAGYLTRAVVPPPAQPPSPTPPAPPYNPPVAGGPSTYQPPPQPTYQPQPQYYQPQQQYANQPIQQYSAPLYGEPELEPQQQFPDPNLRALYEQNAALQDRLNRVESAQQYSTEQNTRAQMAHYEQIIESTVSKFATDYSLPPNITKAVRETAARIGAANTYMLGTHPVTGLPVRPDPHEAVRTALSIAYYATPAAQELERDRVIQRATQDVRRRQRLSGVGGSSASVPRNPPQPNTPQERRTAMETEMREMFNGTWTGN